MNTKSLVQHKQRISYLLVATVAIAAVWSLVMQQDLQQLSDLRTPSDTIHQQAASQDVNPVYINASEFQYGMPVDVGNSHYNLDVNHVSFSDANHNAIITPDELYQAVGNIPDVSSFIVYQHGELKAERFWRNHQRNRQLNIKSASKNLLSTLVGFALQDGFIESIDDPISRYLSGYMRTVQSEAKQRITVRHLLTMSSGLPSTSFGNYGRWVASRDWTRAALGGELEAEPGTRMRYSTGDTHILSAVLTEATGMSTRAYAESRLFQPIGVRIGGWDRSPEGYYFGGNNMALSPAGLLEYGKLYLNGGRFNGDQLLPEAWVIESMQPVFRNTSFNPRGHNYGYLWWSNTFGNAVTKAEVFFAWGYGGQYVFVIPSLDAVVVITGNPDTRSRGMNGLIYQTMDEFVVPFLSNQNGQNE